MTREKKKQPVLYSRMSKPIKSNIYVEQGGFWRRLGAFVIDFVLAGLIAILAYLTLIHPIWYNNLGGYEKNEALHEEQLKSKLYTKFGFNIVRLSEISALGMVVSDEELADPLSFYTRLDNEEGTIVASDVYYDASIRYFYNNYLTFNESTYYNADTALTKNYDRDILLFTGEESDFIVSKTMHEVETSTNGEVEVNTFYTFEYKEGASKEDINRFWEAQYYVAVNDNLSNMRPYFTIKLAITNAIRLMIAISYLIGGLMFHLLVPLLSKDGQSIGKITTKIAVVNKEGYRVKPWQIVVRFLITDIFEVIASMYLYFIPLLLTMAVVTLSRQQRSIHDFIASTRVINFSNSYIFKDEEEVKKYMLAKATGSSTDIYPGGGLGVKEMKERIGDPLK